MGVAPISPAWKAITLIRRPFRARYEQGCFRRSTVKLPASVWCSGAGVAPASPAIKGEVVQSDNPQSASLSGNRWRSTIELAATGLKVGG
ncbi:hypothetical protein NIES2135_15050 [Leptolyngbya boryana NIES-2135]|uniref:Uncharacterized protein n=1 Tax=Leptolyngbya boryana NIES-2135 TaxID=1973484 RepID=A0A1Z4JDZ0_LEPBY|nr:hypothetical protein NIES2135_15050 [Leptolyngbya boryana NIES-2135]